eukprot:14259584-Ditylum_brightwellii.AAC.1
MGITNNGYVLKGTMKFGEFEVETSAGTGDKYSMTKKEQMDALMFSENRRWLLQFLDNQKLLIGFAWILEHKKK